MTKDEAKAIIAHVAEVVPQAIVNAGGVDRNCILASRAAVEALRAEGVRARALVTRTTVVNAPMAERLNAGQTLSEETTDEWREAGAFYLLVDEDPAADGFAGHVVAIANEHYLLDPSADQFNRPAKGIAAAPFWAEAPGLARGTGEAYTMDDGCVWLYEARPERRDHLAAPGWSAYRTVVRPKVVELIRTTPGENVIDRLTIPRPGSG